MIRLTQRDGTKMTVTSRDHISALVAASTSQAWHGVRTNVQLMVDGKWYEVRETMQEIEIMMGETP